MTIRITDIDGRKPTFTQWDVDRVLYIDGCDSQPCLHFANAMLKRAIVVQAEADGSRWVCRVPNFMLQFAKPMAVSVFLQPDEGRTVLTQKFDVHPKLKPQDYTYEENIGYTNWVQKSQEAEELLDDIEDLRQEIADAAETANAARDQAVAAAANIGFTAIYGETTGQDICEAYAAGKACQLRSSILTPTSDVYHLDWCGQTAILGPGGTTLEWTAIFTAVKDREVKTVKVIGSNWSESSSYTLAKGESPTFTGTPKAPTAAAGTSTTQIATTAFVQQAISALEQRIQALEGGN